MLRSSSYVHCTDVPKTSCTDDRLNPDTKAPLMAVLTLWSHDVVEDRPPTQRDL